MVKNSPYHARYLGSHALHPETLMVNYGYSPELSEGAVKPPVYLTSTFAFESAAHGKEFFDIVSGRVQSDKKGSGLIYSRFNHPNSEIVEDRLSVLEGGGEAAAIFSSGMSAIMTSILTFAQPGDFILHNQPLYGGTETLFGKILPRFGIKAHGFSDGHDEASVTQAIQKAKALGNVKIIYVETPSNPLNTLVDIELVSRLRDSMFNSDAEKPMIMVDNTLLGPIFQKPLELGADLSIYSLTKYIGGHSDLVAGAVIGKAETIRTIKLLRSAFGTQLDPHSSWMIGRSLETVTLRMQAANDSARKIVEYLNGHPKVERVFYLGFLEKTDPLYSLFHKQCKAAGSTFSFNIRGGQAEAFAFLDHLQIFKLAVSLGGTESLACHPATTVHSGVPIEIREKLGISESTIRISIGLEHPSDLCEDLKQAFDFA